MKTAIVLFVLMALWPAEALAQGRHDQYGQRGWERHRHWDHRRPAPPPQQGIDFGAIIGGLAGAFGGGSRPSQDAIAYCMGRYRSYNPETGIYYGYDGRPRRCP